MRGSMPRPSIPVGAEPWLARAIEDLTRYAGGEFGAMASERWRWSEGTSAAGATVVQLERKVNRGWEAVLKLPLLAGEAAWNPPAVASGATATATVAVPGAVVGQPAVVGFSLAIPAGAFMVAAVSAPGVVTVTLVNLSGAAVDLGAGILKVVLP